MDMGWQAMRIMEELQRKPGQTWSVTFLFDTPSGVLLDIKKKHSVSEWLWTRATPGTEGYEELCSRTYENAMVHYDFQHDSANHLAFISTQDFTKAERGLREALHARMGSMELLMGDGTVAKEVALLEAHLKGLQEAFKKE